MDYDLLDSGEGRRLERFGKYILDRPDPEVLWKKKLTDSDWKKNDAFYLRKWINKTHIPSSWNINVEDLKFILKLTPFKHTGIFPEQLWQWQYIFKKIKEEKRQLNVLNLFAYTGVATLFAAKAGAKVTHVDASKPAITWANENRSLNHMDDAPIRWIVDDALKFTQREVKRGVKYDVIIMDPPVYGHGPSGIPWDFSKDIPKLLTNCKQILSDNPIFVLINAYAVSTSPITLANTLVDFLELPDGNIRSGELTLTEKSGGRTLSTGVYALWEKRPNLP